MQIRRNLHPRWLQADQIHWDPHTRWLQPYEFIGIFTLDGCKPIKFIGILALDRLTPYKFKGCPWLWKKFRPSCATCMLVCKSCIQILSKMPMAVKKVSALLRYMHTCICVHASRRRDFPFEINNVIIVGKLKTSPPDISPLEPCFHPSHKS